MAERYLWPPRPSEAIPFEEALKYYDGRADWVAQYKFNDSRSLVWFRAGSYSGAPGQRKVELWGRHNDLADYVMPASLEAELWAVHKSLSPSGQWLALDAGLFNSRHSHPWMKNKLALYDILASDGKPLLGTSRLERYQKLVDLVDIQRPASIPFKDGNGGVEVGCFVRGCEHLLVPADYDFSVWPDMWKWVNEINEGWLTGHGDVSPVLEGLMFKYNLGRLEPMIKEKSNQSWMCRSRVETRRHRF